MNRLIAVTATWLLLAPTVSMACSLSADHYDQRVIPDLAARKMVAEATYIDVVIADRATNDFEVGTRKWRRWKEGPSDVDRRYADEELQRAKAAWGSDGARIHYRVAVRLKGSSAPEFTLDGALVEKTAGWRKTKRKPVSLNQLQFYLDQADLTDGPQMGDCTSAILAELGTRYLVFRDADGYPLRTEVPVLYSDRLSRAIGPAVVPIVGDSDSWLQLVRASIKGPK